MEEGGKQVQMPWKEYLQQYVDEGQHELIRRNVLLATRNFQHRVEMFKKEVIFGSNNPMKIRHVSYRVEFQGRGAGHIHGVFWVDLKEVKVEGVGDTVLKDAFVKLRLRNALNEEEVEAVEKFTDMFTTCTRCTTVAGEEAVRIAEEVNWHGHSKSCRKAGPQCRWNFPRFPLAKTKFIDVNREVHEEEYRMPKEKREEILRRVMGVLVDEEGGKMILSKNVERIMLTFPNVKRTKRSKAAKTAPEDEQLHPDNNNYSYTKEETANEYEENIKKRIEMILKEASAGGEPINYYQYEMAVEQQPRKGSTVLLRRDIDEVFVNNYNPEFIVAWDANMDLQPVFDFYGVITYVTDYWAKDSTGLTDVLKTAVKQLQKDGDMRKKCNDLANVFMSHRQVGEAEAYYKVFPHMNLVYSSVATVYVPTEGKEERRHFLQRQDPKGGKGFKVKDREGLFMEKPDLISKYERRKLIGSEEDNIEDDTLENMCFSQFVKMYESKGWRQTEKTNEEGEVEESVQGDQIDEGELAEEDRFNYVITGDEEGMEKLKVLPQAIMLRDHEPGEPQHLHKRTFPRALRFFKKNFDLDPHKFYLTELILYFPFLDENDLFPNDAKKCEQLYRDNEEKINRVKAQVMPFLESVEEAQIVYEQSKDKEGTIEEKMGAELDAEKEQEVADAEEEDDEDHPDYLHIDPEQVEEVQEGEVGVRESFQNN